MDIVEILESRGIEVKRSASDPNEISICCVFCAERGEAEDTRFRLGLNPAKGKAHCFNCDFSSSSWDYVAAQLAKKLDVLELMQAHRIEISGEKEELKPIRLPCSAVPLANRPLDYWGRKAWRYVRSRGISTKQLREHNICYAIAGYYRYRILFPIMYKGKLYAIQGRTFVDSRLKYKNSPGQKLVYNIPASPQASIVLSEGVWDCLAIERGIRKQPLDSGAIFGHSITELQMMQLQSYRNVILWLDPDKAGAAGIRKSYHLLTKANKKVFIVWPKENDPDPSDIDRKEINERVRNAQLLTEGLLQKLRNKFTD